MVKEFLKCNSIRERIQFLANTVLKDWDASELDTVMDIMGLSKEGMERPRTKSAPSKNTWLTISMK